MDIVVYHPETSYRFLYLSGVVSYVCMCYSIKDDHLCKLSSYPAKGNYIFSSVMCVAIVQLVII